MAVRSYFQNTKSNFMVPHVVVQDPKFREQPSCAKWLYTCFCKVANQNADNEGWFYHSIKQLEELSGMDRKTVIRAKKILKTNKFIDVKRGFLEHTGERKYDYFRLNGFTFKNEE